MIQFQRLLLLCLGALLLRLAPAILLQRAQDLLFVVGWRTQALLTLHVLHEVLVERVLRGGVGWPRSTGPNTTRDSSRSLQEVLHKHITLP